MAEKVTIESLNSYLLCSSVETLPVTIGQSTIGRGLFATKRIKKGSLIFLNKAIAMGPRADSIAEKFCSNCFQICALCYPCEKCCAFICSEYCNKSTDHTQLCVFIQNNWKLKTKSHDIEEIPKVLNQVLLYLRFLLLPEDQKILLNIFQKSNSKSSFDELEIILAKYFIPEEQTGFIKIVNSVVKINSFRISDCPNEKKIRLRGLYPLSAFMNHNCVPNTRNVFSKDYTMAVYATKDIEIGEEISSCYTGLLWCSPARRCQLYKSKQFWCNCKRCMDNTEMGTKLSALKCLKKECIGDILPVNPLDPRTHWLCDSCKELVSPDTINNIQSVLGSLVGTLDLDSKLRMENAVLKRLAIFIPYTNHIFVDIQLRLAIKLGFEGDCILNELSESRLALKERLCRGTLRTLAALGAGDAHLRGLLLYHLHAALAERARRRPDLYEELKSEIENTIEQAYNILQGDLSAPPDLELRRQYLGPGCDKPHEERFFILDTTDTFLNCN